MLVSCALVRRIEATLTFDTCRPPEDSREIKYLQDRRKELGGYLPAREVRCPPLKAPPLCPWLPPSRCRAR